MPEQDSRGLEQDSRGLEQKARGYATRHLQRLSREVLAWQKTGRLPKGGLFPDLAAMVAGYLGEDDAFQQVERLVTRLALEALAEGKPLEACQGQDGRGERSDGA